MIVKQLPITKITRPVLTGVSQRKRLFQQIEAARNRPVVWLSGPPGSGKTTLVASYVEAQKIPCLWFRVDEGDADIASFFHYMSLSANNAAPLKKKSLPLFSQEYLHSIPTFAKRYFEDLYSRLNPPSPAFIKAGTKMGLKKGANRKGTEKRSDNKGFIIVFDNYQEVPVESNFHAVIRDGLTILPEKINVIVISREIPPPQLVRLQANSQISFIGWDDIRLTPDETREIIRMRGHIGLDEDTLLQLQKRTDGWAAGLVLIMEMGKVKNVDYHASDKILPEEIFNYFASEIFDKADRETRYFLMKTAFFPELTRPMAGELTGNRKASLILSSLYKKNYFIQRHGHDSEVYQYHPIFRQFLLARAGKTFTPEQVFQIRHAAAVILKAHDQSEDALGLFRAAEDWPEAVRLILKQAPAMVAQGRSQTLEAWIGMLPGSVIEENPWILYWMGICRIPFNSAESLGNFEKAFELFRTKKDPSGIFLAWSGVVESIVYGYEGLKPLDHWFSIFNDLWSKYKEFPSRDIEARVTCSMIRGLSFRRPPDSSTESWADRAYNTAQTCPDMKLKIQCLVNLACYWYSGAEFQKLELILDSIRDLLNRLDLPPLLRLVASWVEAAHANITSMYDRCLKVVSYGLELANASGVHVMDYLLMGHGALTSMKTGDLVTARKYLRRMASSLTVEKAWGASFYHYVAAWEALYCRNLTQAVLHSEQCLKLCEDTGNPWTLSLAHLLKASVCHVRGDDEKLTEHLNQADRIGAQSKNKFIHFACLLIRAYVSLQKGDEASAVPLLKQGMRIGRENGFVNLYMWLPGAMEDIMVKALDAGIDVPYVQDLVRRNSLFPESTPLGVENWPWPLKIYTLGRFGIVKDGKPVRFSGKVQQKPLSLLKVLIALGGRSVSTYQINDALWPDSDGDAAHTAFSTTLHRLRQLLGYEKAVHVQEGKLTLDDRYCWVDAWAFERLLTQADDLCHKDLTEKAIYLMQNAINMYHGHFFEEGQMWVITLREHLRNKFMQTVKNLGAYRENMGQWDQAINCYQKGLEVDDLAEEFYQRLMICYRHLGFRSDAISAYQRCRKTLTAALGIAPSQTTRAIYESLLSMNQ
jgi:ATP/maltotriose-dependent transcriptional regulator MalT/DNA-binding SARP family transcriptional activator